MKLSSFALADIGVLHVLNPQSGLETGVTITIMSKEHKDARSQLAEEARKLRSLGDRARKQTLEDPIAQRERMLDRIAFMTLGWSGLEEDDGSPMVFSRERARAIYDDPRFAWLVEQVTDFITERDGFFAHSAMTSSPSLSRTSD